jgi:hypothetical protein
VIDNATLTRIDTSTSTPATGKAWTAGAALAVRCLLDNSVRARRFAVAADVADATAVLYVEDDAWPAAGVTPPAAGGRVVVQLDSEDAAQLLQVLSVAHPTNGSLDHRQFFLKGL